MWETQCYKPAMTGDGLPHQIQFCGKIIDTHEDTNEDYQIG